MYCLIIVDHITRRHIAPFIRSSIYHGKQLSASDPFGGQNNMTDGSSTMMWWCCCWAVGQVRGQRLVVPPGAGHEGPACCIPEFASSQTFRRQAGAGGAGGSSGGSRGGGSSGRGRGRRRRHHHHHHHNHTITITITIIIIIISSSSSIIIIIIITVCITSIICFAVCDCSYLLLLGFSRCASSRAIDQMARLLS